MALNFIFSIADRLTDIRIALAGNENKMCTIYSVVTIAITNKVHLLPTLVRQTGNFPQTSAPDCVYYSIFVTEISLLARTSIKVATKPRSRGNAHGLCV